MKWIINTLAALPLAFYCGCDRQDMYKQSKYEPLQASQFFDDQRSARPVVPDTVARGQLRTNAVFFTGMSGTNLVTMLPVPLTTGLLHRGQERFNISCAPCHDRTGSGNGMIVQRGFRQPPSFHIQRLLDAPIGYFYDVQARGFGMMPDYAAQVAPEDRWAIAAYIRALQLSQHAKLEDVPPEQRAQLGGTQP